MHCCSVLFVALLGPFGALCIAANRVALSSMNAIVELLDDFGAWFFAFCWWGRWLHDFKQGSNAQKHQRVEMCMCALPLSVSFEYLSFA